MADLSSGVREFLRRTRVWTHFHDRGTVWPNNSADSRASDLVWWFKRNFIDDGLADALVLTPYTDPEKYEPYTADSPAMQTLLNHQRSLADRSREARYPVLGGVEAQIIPLRPGDIDSETFDVDVPLEVREQLDYVIASAHSQPAETEKSLPHVEASRISACLAAGVHAIGHIDRYVQHLPWPNRDYFKLLHETGVAFELNGNYLRRFGLLRNGVEWADSWDHVAIGDQLMSHDDFQSAGYEGLYLDYRYTHMVRMAVEEQVEIIPGLDWHLWHDPTGMDAGGGLSDDAVNRLNRFGAWMALREVPVDLCPTRNIESFRELLAA
jgi:hypothetical protein